MSRKNCTSKQLGAPCPFLLLNRTWPALPVRVSWHWDVVDPDLVQEQLLRNDDRVYSHCRHLFLFFCKKITGKKSVQYNSKILLQTHLHSPKSENIYQDNCGYLSMCIEDTRILCSDFKTFHYMGFICNDVMWLFLNMYDIKYLYIQL